MVDKYKNITYNTDFYLTSDVDLIETHVPSPSDNDYINSYITRYFIRKSNDTSTPIFEVSNYNISKYTSNPFYIWTQIDWKISKAPIEDVEMMNKKSVLLGQRTFPNLSLYLPNLSQFYKEIDY